ncbi:LacI family DNA-binding transcriptional regulator [Cellulomonas sp. C5510]|uniref:LacI family DNA-binding transcriptional regulator n=1 Tax=Cellulomonas sp. C5510 TaxID=2871170 RepID=UPI001C96006C|nr:LacI family DNA-binding transcriptional regulator [Cellulomonas sp. C5510]QZN86238.1 LacI family DNA-binding transcriptional regulator [Cellulomonas sp. C5510]
MSDRPRRPTLEQVAAAAGVSTSTASKVLNGRPGISAETRRRVEEAIDALGYAPTTGPRAGTPPVGVAVVFRTLSDIYAMRVLEGVVASAREHGIEVAVDVLDVPGGSTPPLSPGWIRRQAAPDRAGVVLVTLQTTPEQQALLRDLGVATVHIDPVNPLDDSTVSVGSTNFSGGVQATRHLLDLGHRRIAFAGGAESFLPSSERLQGYLSMMRAGGGQVDEALVRSRAHTFAAGLEMADHVLDQAERPTAVFAASDSIALGVLASAQRHGLRVPQDLSVVGFDDSPAASSSAPPLTTVRQPVVEMGRVALRTLLQLARGEGVDSHHVQLSTTLVVRESTAPPAG